MSSAAFQIVELSGHIIDSLTLAKVIDKIQAMGVDYQINDLQIGEKKNDFSSAQISLWSEDRGRLESLLEELKAYGAYPVQEEPINLEPCPEDGVVPRNTYLRMNPPTEILYENTWVPVDRQGVDMAIVVDPQSRRAQLKRVSDLRQGDMVVVGKSGIKVLPTLGENAHAQPVAK